MHITTKLIRSLAFLLIALVIAACGGQSSGPSQGGSSSSSQPLNLEIIDAGGYVSLFKPVFDAYAKAHPDKVAKITYPPRVQAPALPGKIKAEQDSGRITTSLIMSGYDGVASLTQQGLVEPIVPDHANLFPNLDDNYLPGAKAYNDLAKGYALVFAYTPSGPLFEYDPAKVPNPPQTIAQLQSWIHANPGKFLYARPSNSGPGRTMLMGLPYLLGDKDPKDPTNGWDKTWAFLKDIGSTINAYPTRTGDTMTALAKGDAWIIASTFGWDINPRFLNQVPAGDKTFMLQDTTLVADAGFMLMPKGLDKATQDVVLDMMAWMLKPDQQAADYDEGYFYPGPAVKNVPLSLASAHSQQVVQQFGRPEYDTMIASTKVVAPLDTAPLNAAFATWDKNIGTGKFHP
jgi:putative spermidine/putrescine transport system substrate-binding protein